MSICKCSSDDLNGLNVEVNVSVSLTTRSLPSISSYRTIISKILVIKHVLC